MKAALGYVLIACWACALLGGMWLYSRTQLSEFDPALQLNSAAAEPGFDERVVEALIAAGATPGSVIHFARRQNCFCETLTQPHRQQLLSALAGFSAITLDPDNIAFLSAFLSHTPAVAVIDRQRRLRYLGPYAQGYGCMTGRTFVEAIISSVTTRYNPAAVVNSNATGCFCQR